jgi:hypothetical protein
MSPSFLSQWIGLAMVVFMGAVFAADVTTPLGIVTGILYVIPVYLAGWFLKTAYLYGIAMLCSVLIVVAWLLSPPGGIPWIAHANHSLAVVAIWATAALALLHRRLSREIKVLRGLLPTCAHCKKIRDAEGHWVTLEHYISDHSEAEFTHTICSECGARYFPQCFARETGQPTT